MAKDNSTLFDLVGVWKEVYEMADDPDIDMEAWNGTLESIEGEIEVKADGYAAVIAKLNADIDQIKTMEKRLKARRDAMANSIDRMKSRLEDAMRLTGKTKFKTTFWSFNIQKNPESVVIDNQEAVPKEFLKYAEPTVDKTALKEALKNGADLEGIAHLTQTEGLRIR